MKARYGSLLLALVLAACGGGGGSSLTTTVSSGSGVQQVSVQRSLASQTLFDTQATAQIVQFGGGGSLGTLSVLRRTVDASLSRNPSAIRTMLTVCNGGAEITSTFVGATETQIHEQTFYDPSCTLLFQDIHLDVVAGGTSATLSGTETQYTRAGNIFAYDTISGSLNGVGTSLLQVNVQVADAASSTSPVRAVAGLSCNIGVASQTCGSGAVEHLASLSEDFGATLSANVSVLPVPGAASVAVANFSGNGASYKGTLNALTLSEAPFPGWGVSGGMLADSVTLSGVLTFSGGGILTGGSLSIVDAAADATVNVVASGSPLTISGVIRQTDNGQTMATFTVDANGNGTITYSNGTTALIIAWQIAG